MLQRADFAGAQRAAEARLSLLPKDRGAYVNLASVFFYKGEPTRAIEPTKGKMPWRTPRRLRSAD